MGNKEKLEELLINSGDNFISGSSIAEKLGVSRAAVWKNVRQLENDGYIIEAVNNKGYRLAPENDVISTVSFLKHLGKETVFNVQVFESIGSTNTYLKENAERLPDLSVAAAGNQTSGKGRTGRSFFSPPGTGIYLSILLKQNIRIEDAGCLTTAAAVSACRAIEECADEAARIKWVNDIFVRGKKVCGILTEASVNYETGSPDWIVVGAGFNVYEPEGGFPEEISSTAGAITDKKKKNLRSALGASFIRNFYGLCRDLGNSSLYPEYRERCFIPGNRVDVISGEERIPALALDIDSNFGLRVRYDDGREEVLKAGEVSIRPMI